MSISTEITRLQTAKADLKTAIEAKGVTVGDITIDGYAAKVAEIPQGSDKDITVKVPTVTGAYTYNGTAQSAVISGYYSGLMTKSGTESATNAGTYSVTFTLNDTTTTAWDDGTTTAKTLTWSIAKAALPKPTISPTSFSFNPNSTSGTMTVTRSGDGAITATSSDTSVLTASVSGTTVTVTAIDTSTDTNETVTITVAEGTNYLAYTATDVVADVAIASVAPSAVTASVSGLGNSNPTSQVYTRDEDFPTSFEEVTFNGDVFVKIPTMYRKIDNVTDGQITAFTMATDQIDNTYEPYSCFVAPDNSILPYVLIGKYCYSSSSAASSTTGNPVASVIGNARTQAQARGTGYQQYDWQIQKLFVDLCLLISQTVNFNSGQGVDNYLGVYNINKPTWVDGCAVNGATWLTANNPANYVDEPTSSSTGYTALWYAPPSANGKEIMKLGYDANNAFANFPSAITSNSNYNTYYCDSYYYSSGSHPTCDNIGYTANTNGLWCCDLTLTWTNVHYARLCYRPISS